MFAAVLLETYECHKLSDAVSAGGDSIDSGRFIAIPVECSIRWFNSHACPFLPTRMDGTKPPFMHSAGREKR